MSVLQPFFFIGVTPTVTPSLTPSITASITPSVTPEVTPTSSVTPSTTAAVTPTFTPTNSVTPSSTPAVTPSITPTPTPSTASVVGGSGNLTSVLTSVTPNSVSVDSSNNVYWMDYNYSTQAGTVKYYNGTSTTTVLSNTNTDYGNSLVSDNSGTGFLYWSKRDTGAVIKYNGSTATAIFTGQVRSVAVDSSGNVWSLGANTLRKMNSTGTVSYTFTGFSPYSTSDWFAVDNSGNAYISAYIETVVSSQDSYNTGYIIKVNTNTNTVTQIYNAGAYVAVGPVVTDSSGNVYFWNNGVNKIYKWDGSSNTVWAGNGTNACPSNGAKLSVSLTNLFNGGLAISPTTKNFWIGIAGSCASLYKIS